MVYKQLLYITSRSQLTDAKYFRIIVVAENLEQPDPFYCGLENY